MADCSGDTVETLVRRAALTAMRATNYVHGDGAEIKIEGSHSMRAVLTY